MIVKSRRDEDLRSSELASEPGTQGRGVEMVVPYRRALAAVFSLCLCWSSPAATNTDTAANKGEPPAKLVLSEPSVLLVGQKLPGDHGGLFYPFDPVLTAGVGGEVRLVSTVEGLVGIANAEASVLSGLQWSGGRWSEPARIVTSSDGKVFGAMALSLDLSRWYVVWFEAPRGYETEHMRIMGRQWLDGKWLSPVDLTSRESPGLPAFPPAIVAARSDNPEVYVVDGRERRMVLGDQEHPRRGVTKIYMRHFIEVSPATERAVTPPGTYVVSFMTAVRKREAGAPGLVYFRGSPTDRHAGTLAGGKRGLYVTRPGEFGQYDSRMILKDPRIARTNEIRFVRAFEGRDHTLTILYPAIGPGKNYSVNGEGSELRMHVTRNDSFVDNMAIASGVMPGNRETYTIKGDIAPDGTLSVVYQGVSTRGSKSGGPLILLAVNRSHLIARATITAASTDVPLFDVAVDENGRTHVVWVEDKGERVYLKHRVADVQQQVN